ncbi:hypothetical protein OROMI_032884 [Orobanche minor]
MWLRSRNTVSYLDAVTKLSGSQWLFLSCFYSDISFKRQKMAPLQERKMIDRFRLRAKGGDGGNGCSSFRRSRHDRRGRPDGGNGGRGGDVILECSAAVWDFRSLQHHINAKRGGHGAPKNMIGSRGADKVVLVPVGTVIHLLEGDLPSSVDKKSSGMLDPWEIPGTLDFESSESSQQPSTVKSKRTQKTDNLNKDSAHSSDEILKEPHVPSQLDFLPQNPPSSYNCENGPESNGPPVPRGYGEREDFDSETKPLPSQLDFLPRNSPPSYKCQSGPKSNCPLVPRGYSEWEDFDTETNMSESECEEILEETEQIQYNVAELTEAGQRITVARGGDGGLGNLHYSKGSKTYRDNNNYNNDSDDEVSVDDAPNIGLTGSETLLLLELKSIADVGLVGMPNAGKSTLLGAMSRAKPIVGHYAFTTLRPNLGKLDYDDLSFTVADIPGLVKGAHENRGLGHAFLRHIERTKVLAYVLDLVAGLDGRKGVPPWEQLKDLMLELELYCEGLSCRPSLVVANKIDEKGAEEVYKELRERVPGVAIFPVCAVLEEGVSELKDGLKMLVNGEESMRLKVDSIVLD